MQGVGCRVEVVGGRRRVLDSDSESDEGVYGLLGRYKRLGVGCGV